MHLTLSSAAGAIAAATLMLLSSCVSTPGPLSVPASSVVSQSIGWLHGGCIALPEADVAVGTGVVLVSLVGTEQQVMPARIQGRTDSPDDCPALLEDRRRTNLANGLSFYRVEPAPAEMAIGVLSGSSPPADPGEVLDTNRDGRRDIFSQCTTAEGVQFSVWAKAVGQGEPLWRGYYYLGYDVESDCPQS